MERRETKEGNGKERNKPDDMNPGTIKMGCPG